MWCGIYGIDGILLWDIMDGICQYYHGDITMGYYGIILQIFCKYSGWDMPTIVWYDVHRCLGHKMVPILRMVHILCSTFAVGPSDLIDIWPRAVCFGFIMWTWVKIGDGHKFCFQISLNGCLDPRIPPSFGRQKSVRFCWQSGRKNSAAGNSSGTGADADRRGLGDGCDGWKKIGGCTTYPLVNEHSYWKWPIYRWFTY